MRQNRLTKKLNETFGDPIGSYAGDAPVGVRSEDDVSVCPSCEMTVIDGDCGCVYDDLCDCGMPPEECVCGPLDESVEPCPGCGLIPVDGTCACNREDDVMSVDHSGATASVEESVEPCAECGMLPVEGVGCECVHMQEYGVDEVAPPGKEKMVKALKKDPDIDNPWAVAWSVHNKQKQGR
jgi:hypothetical protein